MRSWYVLAGAAAACLLAAVPAAAHKVALDAGLYTLYSGPADGTSLNLLICGSLPQSSGCYGSAQLNAFEAACAVLEGKPKTKDNVVTRAIYVLDRRASEGSPVRLVVYTRTDTISESSDQVQIVLKQQVDLALVGGPKAKCEMAANDSFLYAGTNKTTNAVSIDAKTLASAPLGGFSPPEHVRAITADDRGYVTVSFDDGFYTFAPDGTAEAGGGGAYKMANTRNAFHVK